MTEPLLQPAPLTPPDCDLTDFAFMPLDVARLRDSELASNETPEACWAAVLLWAAAWHQIPAASMPNDDRWIAKAAGYAQRGKIAKEWAEVRVGALRGWIECDDGRLYHPVVAEKATEAWQAKLEQRHRTECARIKKHNDRHHTTIEKPSFDEWMSLGCPVGQPLFVPRDTPPCTEQVAGETTSKRQGEGQGQGHLRDSEANASAAGAAARNVDKSKSPADMTKAELWQAGKSLLRESGVPEAQCGSFVGKLVTDYGDAIVVDAVRSTVVATPADPKEYLKAACMRLKGERAADHGKPLTVPSKDNGQTAAWIAAHTAPIVTTPEQRAATAEMLRATKERMKGVTA